ncbi:MAG TPA: amidohydrolase family protein [Steroidobacteraceae bacterium]|jgi:imidazolonepropionase-like amidohydrolase|nr:amidohydrolase family protein [Steroidobacteraceae bacterium]
MKTLLASLLLLITAPLYAQVVAIRAGTVIDPAHGVSAKDQVILVEGGKIKAMGAGLAIPAGAEVIDLSHEWLTPGLIDAHTHMTLTEIEGDAPFESFYLNQSSTLRGLRGLHNSMEVLRAGFTTLRDVGNSAEWAMSDVRRAIESGWFVGPTIIDSGKIIAPFGGQSHNIPPKQGPFWQFEYIDADGPAEIRKAVRTNIYYGAGVIKLVADNNPYHYSIEEFRAAVDEAHRAGIPVAVHVYAGDALENAIEAGVDSIEHGFDLTDAQMKRMKDKGIFLVGTDFPRAHLDIVGTSGGILPEPTVLAPKIIDRLKRANRVGVRMAFGSDTVIDMPGRTRADLMFDYLAVWRAAGVAPMDILRAMTTNAAELLRINKTRGSIAVGLSADIVATPANPLEDIEGLRKIDFVMKDGKIVRKPASH